MKTRFMTASVSGGGRVMACWRLSWNDKFVIAMTTTATTMQLSLAVTDPHSAEPASSPHHKTTTTTSSSSSASLHRHGD